MKTAKMNFTNIIIFLVVSLASQSALAFYDPSTGRWLSRDPVGEPGFQALQSTASSQTGSSPSEPSRWIHRDTAGRSASAVLKNMSRAPSVDALNLYLFVENNPLNRLDAFGLASIPKDAEGCFSAHPLFPDDPACDKYGEKKYLGIKLSCFCKCPLLKDWWSLYVRGCLSCMNEKGVPVDDAHKACYEAADKMYKRPTAALAACWCHCR